MIDTYILFLASNEVIPNLSPRKCKILQRLWSDERQDYFLRMKIEPPINGHTVQIDKDEIDEVVVATRHKGASLHPISGFPVVVYICSIVNEVIRSTGIVSAKDLKILLIGEIFSNLEDAEKSVSFESRRN